MRVKNRPCRLPNPMVMNSSLAGRARLSRAQNFSAIACLRLTHHAIRNTQYATRNTQHAIRNTQYAIRNTQYAIRNTQYAIRNTQYATRNTQHAIRNTQYATRMSCQRTQRSHFIQCFRENGCSPSRLEAGTSHGVDGRTNLTIVKFPENLQSCSNMRGKN